MRVSAEPKEPDESWDGYDGRMSEQQRSDTQYDFTGRSGGRCGAMLTVPGAAAIITLTTMASSL